MDTDNTNSSLPTSPTSSTTERDTDTSQEGASSEVPHKPTDVVEFGIDEDSFIHLMRCSLCKSIVPAPLEWSCEDGHLICSDCILVVPYCPYEPEDSRDARNICRYGFVEATFQLYDHIYNTTIFNCVFKRLGCEVQPAGANFDTHVQMCPFNPSKQATETPDSANEGEGGYEGNPFWIR